MPSFTTVINKVFFANGRPSFITYTIWHLLVQLAFVFLYRWEWGPAILHLLSCILLGDIFHHWYPLTSDYASNAPTSTEEEGTDLPDAMVPNRAHPSWQHYVPPSAMFGAICYFFFFSANYKVPAAHCSQCCGT